MYTQQDGLSKDVAIKTVCSIVIIIRVYHNHYWTSLSSYTKFKFNGENWNCMQSLIFLITISKDNQI